MIGIDVDFFYFKVLIEIWKLGEFNLVLNVDIVMFYEYYIV